MREEGEEVTAGETNWSPLTEGELERLRRDLEEIQSDLSYAPELTRLHVPTRAMYRSLCGELDIDDPKPWSKLPQHPCGGRWVGPAPEDPTDD